MTIPDGGQFQQYEREVFAALQAYGEPERVPEAQNDKKSQLAFLAVRVPAIERVVRSGLSFYRCPADEILAAWNAIWCSSPYFEVMAAAAMYYSLQRAKIDPDTWPTLSTWVRRCDNWAHADQLAGVYSYLLAQRRSEVYSQLAEWNASDDQWLRRISLISCIHYTGKNAVFLPPEQVLPLVARSIHDTRYYVQKATGWVLRELGLVYPREIREFIVTHIDMPAVAFSRAIERRNPEERAALRATRNQAGLVHTNAGDHREEQES
jgi:3-methyladenine DNA glycosylase AlkD